MGQSRQPLPELKRGVLEELSGWDINWTGWKYSRVVSASWSRLARIFSLSVSASRRAAAIFSCISVDMMRTERVAMWRRSWRCLESEAEIGWDEYSCLETKEWGTHAWEVRRRREERLGVGVVVDGGEVCESDRNKRERERKWCDVMWCDLRLSVTVGERVAGVWTAERKERKKKERGGEGGMKVEVSRQTEGRTVDGYLGYRTKPIE